MSQTQFSYNSLSYGTGCTRIMFGSAPQWNFQFRRHFHNLIFQNLKEVSHKSYLQLSLFKEASHEMRFATLFRAAESDVLARNSIAFCGSGSADRRIMAASRLLGAAAACVMFFVFCSWAPYIRLRY